MKQKQEPVAGWPEIRAYLNAEIKRREIVPFQLAASTGIPYSTILTALNANATNIKLDTLVRIMNSVGLSWQNIVDGTKGGDECKRKPPKSTKPKKR